MPCSLGELAVGRFGRARLWLRVSVAVTYVTAMLLAGCGGDGGGASSKVVPTNCDYTACGVLSGHSYVVYEPGSLPANAPMLVLLHGANVDLENTESMWQGRRFADRYGYRLVIPQGNGNVWNYSDDIGFVADLIDAVQRDRGPSAGVFVAGWSNGSELSQLLACDYADHVTGVISLAGPLIRGRNCKPSRDIGIALMGGGNDAVVPVTGGAFGTMGLAEAFTAWSAMMGCDGSTQALLDTSLMSGASSITTIAGACRAPVQQTLMASAAHAPGWNQEALHGYMQDFFARSSLR